jgi:hypothetical protein
MGKLSQWLGVNSGRGRFANHIYGLTFSLIKLRYTAINLIKPIGYITLKGLYSS